MAPVSTHWLPPPGEPFLKGDPGRTHRFQQDLTLAALTRQEFCGLRQRPDFLTDATVAQRENDVERQALLVAADALPGATYPLGNASLEGAVALPLMPVGAELDGTEGSGPGSAERRIGPQRSSR